MMANYIAVDMGMSNIDLVWDGWYQYVHAYKLENQYPGLQTRSARPWRWWGMP
jgi:hypothetical protein